MILKNFIAEYKEKYNPVFKDGFWGECERICAKLKDPSFHPSKKLIEILSSISAIEHEAVKIAVIGQFSSGKSTFLNTLLGSEILPTGVVPVTAKPTLIKYAPNEMLSVTHTNGQDEVLEISALANFVDQRKDLKDIKNITIFCKNEILKNISFIDTPGLNSRSNADTNETLAIFDEVFGVLWISLIDNAARASEINEISLLPEFLKDTSIAVLSQKDRLNDDEIKRVSEYAKNTIGNHFSAIVPISSHQERKNEPDSGFSEVKGFLNSLENRRKNFAINKLNLILDSLKFERKYLIEIYEILENIIKTNDEKMQNLITQKSQIYAEEFAKFYAEIKEMSNFISKIMVENISSKQASYFRKKKGLISKENFEKIDYESPYFNKDGALSNLIYNDDRLANSFRKFKNRLAKFGEQILSEFDEIYASFENEILLFKGKFESLERQNEIFSMEEISSLNKIAGEVYELFLKDYERAFFEFKGKVELFFEKIMIKIATNYTNAVVLTADFIDNKIAKSILDYEDDSATFSLYYPKFEDFEKVLLNNLHYYEFENDFLGNGAFINRACKSLVLANQTTTDKNLNYISQLKNRQISAFDRLESINLDLI
ncbi:MAG: dynamin family protein [Campylobacter sp.]|nr:dynamin family protein [Campylobacter sp.]